jgi:hypothetical protein
MATRKPTLKPSPYGHQSMVAFVLYEGGIDKLYMVKHRTSQVLLNKSSLSYSSRNEPLDSKYDLSYMRDYFAGYNNEYLKDARWVMLKVKPPQIAGLHRFEIIETEERTRKALQEVAEAKNKKRNAFDSFYCTAIIGTRMRRAEWQKESLPEEPRHRLMRRILKQPSIWRSYPNLYPKAKDSIPYFSQGGETLYPDSVLPELRPPSVEALPNNLAYAMVNLVYGTVLPTFNSPKVREWQEHGYRMVA